MKTTLITGANRGLGLEFARQLKELDYYVIGCCRDPSKADELNKLADRVLPLDVTSDQSISLLRKTLSDIPIDLLINNAGINGEPGVTVGNIERDNFIDVINVNCISVLKISDALLVNVQHSRDKNILVISSQMGSIADNSTGRSYAYRASKAALNCAMRSFAIDVEASGVHVMLMHPGWVNTDMGGTNAPIDAPTSVAGMLKVVTKKMAESHGDLLHRFDGGTVEW